MHLRPGFVVAFLIAGCSGSAGRLPEYVGTWNVTSTTDTISLIGTDPNPYACRWPPLQPSAQATIIAAAKPSTVTGNVPFMCATPVLDVDGANANMDPAYPVSCDDGGKFFPETPSSIHLHLSDDGLTLNVDAELTFMGEGYPCKEDISETLQKYTD